MKLSKVVTLLTVLTMTGCTSIGQMKGESAAERYVDYAGAPIERFTAFRVSGWTVISRSQLVLWVGVNDAYLITVWDSCQNLQFANRIGVTSTGSSISKFDQVQFNRERCPINEIRPIDISKMKADRTQAREAQP